jgi:hypothetical protein
MTLEEPRIEVMQKLKACRDPVQARELLAEVDLALMKSQISVRAQKRFWEALKKDLDVLAQESAVLLGNQAAVALSGVIVAAQATISPYQLTLASDEDGSAGEPIRPR